MSDRAILPFDAEFLDPMDEVADHMLEWFLFRARNPKCLNPVLPAELVRIPDLGEPAVGLEQGSGRHPAPAAKGAAGVGSAPSHGSIEDRAAVAAPHAAVPLFSRDLTIDEYYDELRRQLYPLLQPHETKFLREHLAPLPEPAELESKDPHNSKVT